MSADISNNEFDLFLLILFVSISNPQLSTIYICFSGIVTGCPYVCVSMD